MGSERLARARKRVAGKKETRRALENDQLSTLYIARDADDNVVRDLLQIAEQKDVEVVEVDSMQEIGEACGLEVGSSSAGVLR